MNRRPRMEDFTAQQHRFIRACAYFGMAVGATATVFVGWWILVIAAVVGLVWECERSAERDTT